MTSFQGILPAVITPFDAEGKFRVDSFERLLDRCYSAGVDGIYVCGQTGEGLRQSAEERKRVAEVAVQHSPKDKTIIVHTGAMSTAEAVDLTKHAARIGAHAVSALPPIGNYSFAEIKAYCWLDRDDVAAAVPVRAVSDELDGSRIFRDLLDSGGGLWGHPRRRLAG
jgi:N-acetylneuraminate lyase